MAPPKNGAVMVIQYCGHQLDWLPWPLVAMTDFDLREGEDKDRADSVIQQGTVYSQVKTIGISISRPYAIVPDGEILDDAVQIILHLTPNGGIMIQLDDPLEVKTLIDGITETARDIWPEMFPEKEA